MNSPFAIYTVTPASSEADLRAMVAAGWHSYLLTLSERGEPMLARHHLHAMLGAAGELALRLDRQCGVF